MAKLVAGPVSKVTVAGIDLSDHVSSVTIEDSADEVDVTGYSQKYREFTPGLKDATVTITFWQDYASASVDATIGNLYYNNTAGTVKITPDTGGTVVYTLVGKVYSFPPFSGGAGDAVSMDCTLRNAGTAGLTRGTA